MEGDDGKKRLREEEEEEDQDEDSFRGAKQIRLDGSGLLDLQTKENSGTSHEFCHSLSSECWLKDPWSCEDEVAGSGIGSTAIRKHFVDNCFESSGEGWLGAEANEVQRGFFFEDELWRPPSPLGGVEEEEALFSLEKNQDFAGGDGLNLREDSFLPCAASGFRIWEEEEEEQQGATPRDSEETEGVGFLQEGEVSDWILRAPLDQPLVPESFEFEVSVPNV